MCGKFREREKDDEAQKEISEGGGDGGKSRRRRRKPAKKMSHYVSTETISKREHRTSSSLEFRPAKKAYTFRKLFPTSLVV